MAKIPDSRALGARRVPQARVGISSDRSGEIQGQALVQFGETLQRIDESRQDFRFDVARLDFAKRAVARAETDSEQTFRSGMASESEQIAKAQRLGARHRALFSEQTKLDIERGAMQIRATTLRKEADGARAKLQTDLSEMREAALTTPDPVTREAIIRSVRSTLKSAADSGFISKEADAETWQRWSQGYAEGWVALQSPARRAAVLEIPDGTPATLLQPDQRARLLEGAERDANDELESGMAQRISGAYRKNVRAGDRMLAALDDSGLPPERQDGIRRRVRESVGLMRDERQAEHLGRVTRLESRIATGARFDEVEGSIESLYRSGALSPAQFASLNERAAVNAVRTAEIDATHREIVAAIDAGLPLDPTNSKHKDFLADSFAIDAGRVAAGGREWQGLALAHASRARMLPPQASSWLRSAARSPDPNIATAGAQFLGGLDQQSPEAAADIDGDTRAFLAQLGGMLEAGAEPRAAFDTARANVFESRKDVVDARVKAYGEHAKQTDGILSELIDQDFDTAFSAQPAASVTLRADFDRQTQAYFTKVGDIELARDLAWKDLRRVYGTTRVNGEPVIAAFPIEQFGITPAEARADVTAFLDESGQALDPDDVLIVADSLTLRAVSDALTGKQVAPSYRLVTKDGDLVLGADGVPARYALPSGEDLTARVEAKQAKARQDAERAIAETKARRERLKRSEALNTAAGLH